MHDGHLWTFGKHLIPNLEAIGYRGSRKPMVDQNTIMVGTQPAG